MRKYLTKNEVERIIGAAKNGANPERDTCMIKMCFIHGLRVSELCALKLQDIDLSSKTIYIKRLKNGLSTIHPLIKDEIPYLVNWLETRKRLRWAETDLLFLTQKGGGLSRQWAYLLIKEYGHSAELSVDSHPHMLRHACGYALADLGINTRLIQDYLGHRNIQHTVIYTASNPHRFYGVWDV